MTGILFLCVANSVRSQMAEGFARTWFGSQIVVKSAGSRPTVLHPVAVRVMAEIGIDISHHRSEAVDAVDLASVDTVVTLCTEKECPTLLQAMEQFHWPVLDPASCSGSPEEQLKCFRKIRDEIALRLQKFSEGRSLEALSAIKRPASRDKDSFIAND